MGRWGFDMSGLAAAAAGSVSGGSNGSRSGCGSSVRRSRGGSSSIRSGSYNTRSMGAVQLAGCPAAATSTAAVPEQPKAPVAYFPGGCGCWVLIAAAGRGDGAHRVLVGACTPPCRQHCLRWVVRGHSRWGPGQLCSRVMVLRGACCVVCCRSSVACA